MRINELIVEQEVDEGLGQAIGKAWGGLAKGAGAVAGGLAGTWDAAKQGYQAGKSAVSGRVNPDDSDPTLSRNAPATSGSATVGSGQPASTGTAPAATAPTGQPAASSNAPTAAAPAASNSELDQLKATLGKLNPDQKKELAGELEKSMNAPEGPGTSADAASRGQQNKGFGFNNQTGVAFNSQAEKDAFKAQQSQPGAAPAADNAGAGVIDPAKAAADRQAKNAADAAERDKQIAATKQANATAAQADNDLVAAVKAAKAKPGFQQTAQDKLTIQQGAAKGIHESKKKKKKKLVAEFNSKFLGIKI